MFVVGAIYVSIVSAGRVYLRVHWFTDTVAGVAVGAATTLAFVLLARWWMLRTAD